MFWNCFKNFFLKKKENSLLLVSPMTGETVSLESVPDVTFAQRMVGDGIALLPTDGQVVSPISGKILKMFHTHHACIIQSIQKKNIEILIHIGIDTVKLEGKGFDSFVKEGDIVEQGQPLIKVDLEALSSEGFSLLSPIIISNLSSGEQVTPTLSIGASVEAGNTVIMKI